ncbi:MAG: hypothetical protein LAQ30_22805 [Acidobacteriia bacterium]|nr:hypothetical protein [Terriglobia bacterium]
MRRFVFAVCFALLVLSVTALAADISGTWTGTMAGRGGGEGFTLTYVFKQDGAKLTGNVQGPGGEPLEIKDGKVEGNKMTFAISFEGPNGSMKISNEGTISEKADEIKLVSKFEGGDFGGGEPPTITLKKTK